MFYICGNHFLMKLRGFSIFVLLCCFCSINAKQDLKHLTDSLSILLDKTPENELKRRSELLTHLCMVNATPGRSLNRYVMPLYECALKADDQIGLDYALGYLIDYYIPIQSDSVAYYLNIAKTRLKGEEGLAGYHYFRLQVRAYNEINKSPEAGSSAIDSISYQYMHRQGEMSPYEQMEWNILIGDLLLTKGASYAFQKKSVAYYKRALEIGESLPFKCAYPYLGYAMGNLANMYMSDEVEEYGEEAAKILYKRLENIDKYAQWWKDYPFIAFDNSRMSCYVLLVTLPHVIGKEKAKNYMDLYSGLINKMSEEDAESFGYRDSYYVTSAYYYQRIGDYEHALEQVDSAIISARKNHLSDLLPDRFLWKAQTLKKCGRLGEALDVYEAYMQAKDSIFTAASQKRLNEIEASYGVERMKAENAEMKLRSHKTGAILGSAVFVLLLLIFIYWFRNSRKEKRMMRKEMELQANVLVAEEKALGSERMKASFIQSVVRELRTPLSAINSAAELILDESLDSSCKAELAPIVRSNIMHLNSLVDYMLEVSELDSGLSKNEEVMELGNISDMCQMEVKRISEREPKPGVTYHLDLPDDDHCLINLHKRYFTMMIYALISNAHKFTESGTITICCKVSDDQFEFSIADSGKGIPESKKDWIFERFTKVDPYSSGTGLGLYLCKLITERVKGKIWLDTTYTNGARFVFVMPCSKYC